MVDALRGDEDHEGSDRETPFGWVWIFVFKGHATPPSIAGVPFGEGTRQMSPPQPPAKNTGLSLESGVPFQPAECPLFCRLCPLR